MPDKRQDTNVKYIDDIWDADDPTTICGSSAFPEEAREEYRRAFKRVMEYGFNEGLPGDVMEFGVFGGFTARIFAELMNRYGMPGSLLLFDTFEGFPESCSDVDRSSMKVSRQEYWAPNELATPVGTVEKIRQRLSKSIPSEKIEIHKGLFRETMKDAVWRRKAAIVHLDCDLFESALDVLVGLEKLKCLQDGVVLLFDDYFCNRANPNFGEQAAFMAFLSRYEHYEAIPWFTYGWGAAAFFLHDRRVTDQSGTEVVKWGPPRLDDA